MEQQSSATIKPINEENGIRSKKSQCSRILAGLYHKNNTHSEPVIRQPIPFIIDLA